MRKELATMITSDPVIMRAPATGEMYPKAANGMAITL
jgi:hypothetical protein